MIYPKEGEDGGLALNKYYISKTEKHDQKFMKVEPHVYSQAGKKTAIFKGNSYRCWEPMKQF